MADGPLSVYVLTHLVPTTKAAKSRALVDMPFDLAASRESRLFAEWLLREIQPFGQAFDCGSEYTAEGIEAQAIVCLHTPWPALAEQTNVQIRHARGEIMMGVDHLFYVEPDSVLILENEVHCALFAEDHGVVVPDLDAGIGERLGRWGATQLRRLGYTAEAIEDIVQEFLRRAWETPPKDWAWGTLTRTLHKITNCYCEEQRSAPPRWYVYERLQLDDDEDVSTLLSSALVEEAIEAAYDEPGEARQWLVLANPLVGASQMVDPEWETMRSLGENEVFASHGGVVWFLEGEPMWLGEFAGDRYHNRHGEVVHNLEELVREHVVEVLVDRAMVRLDADDETFQRVVHAAHDALDVNDPLKLWFHDLDGLVERVIERAEVVGG